jgi:hypothetical protein
MAPERTAEGPFKTLLPAILSSPFLIACILVDGDVMHERLQNLSDPEIYSVGKKVNVYSDNSLKDHETEIEIFMEDNSSYRERLSSYDPEREEIISLFMRDSIKVLGKEKSEMAISLIKNFENCTDISALNNSISI